jgi:sortase A
MQHTRGTTRTLLQQHSCRFIVALVCALGLVVGVQHSAQATAPTVAVTSESRQVSRLIIPTLEIDAPVEGVGQDDEGLMAAPSTVESVAWYNLGPNPGELGNAVMAGHLDNVKGDPAVFWRLDELKAGDEIIVRFDDESEKRFEVMSVESYEADEAPLTRIFGIDFERDLNLITCDGDWNTKNKLYDKRLVVYARLIPESNAPTESNTTSTLPTPPSTRSIHSWQNRQQSLTTR